MGRSLKVVGASWQQIKISISVIIIIILLSILGIYLGQLDRFKGDGIYWATVVYTPKNGYRIHYWGQSNEVSKLPPGVARASLKTNGQSDRWSFFEVETNGSYPDELQAYAAGLLEGALTWSYIHQNLEHTFRYPCKQKERKIACDKFKNLLDKSAKIWKTFAAEKEHEDPFWHQVSLYYTQLKGIHTGLIHGTKRNRKKFKSFLSEIYWLNMMNELDELHGMTTNESFTNSNVENIKPFSGTFLRAVNESLSDNFIRRKLYIALEGVEKETLKMKIFKRYKMHYRLTLNGTTESIPNLVELTSEPGSVISFNGLYVLKGYDRENENKLVVASSVLRIHNSKLWKDVNIIDHVPLGPRISAANRLASNVSSWGHTLARSNSGTGCKQWVIVDYNKLNEFNLNDENNADSELLSNSTSEDIETEIPGFVDKIMIKHTVVHRRNTISHRNNLVWLIEQVPTRTHLADISDVFMKKSYWILNGVPEFKDIHDLIQANNNETPQTQVKNDFNIFSNILKNATFDSLAEVMRQRFMIAMESEDTQGCRGIPCDEKVIGEDLKKQNYSVRRFMDTKIVSNAENITIIELFETRQL